MKRYPAKFKSFQRKIVEMEALQKVQISVQTLSTQSIQTLFLGDI